MTPAEARAAYVAGLSPEDRRHVLAALQLGVATGLRQARLDGISWPGTPAAVVELIEAIRAPVPVKCPPADRTSTDPETWVRLGSVVDGWSDALQRRARRAMGSLSAAGVAEKRGRDWWIRPNAVEELLQR